MSHTLNTFAYQLGAHARITLAHSLIWHKAYAKADVAVRRTWRLDFMLNFVAGNLDVSMAEAISICALTRTERKQAQENAVRAAQMKFKYHISRGIDAKPSNKTEPARISAAERAAFAAFKKVCGADTRRLSLV